MLCTDRFKVRFAIYWFMLTLGILHKTVIFRVLVSAMKTYVLIEWPPDDCNITASVTPL